MNWKYLLNIVAFRHWTDLFIQDWSQKCVKFHTRLFWQLLITTLSIITSISELKLFVEYHSIQMLNKSFHLGLIYVKFDINLFWPTSYRNTFTYNDYQSTGNLLRISYHSDIEQNFSSRAGHRIVWNPIHIYSDNFQSKHFTTWVSVNWKYLLYIIAFRCWIDIFIQGCSQNFVKFLASLFWQLLIKPILILMSISELKIFVECHTFQIFNRTGLRSVSNFTQIYCNFWSNHFYY